MEMTLYWTLLVLAPFVGCSLADKNSNEVPYIVEYTGNRRYCDGMEIIKWSIAFHECFFDRKVNDGGQNLESIVDRILQHAETCGETSVMSCKPDSEGFRDIMNKTISQIKDYSNMYLKEIYKGKENFKDVQCVENILTLETYVKCFRTTPQRPSVSQKSFERSVKEGLSCASRSNEGCSEEAKSTLNRIVANIFGVSYKEETKPPPPTTEAPKRWYDYILDPIKSAWRAIVSFFG